jgi:hypothetical protein
MAEDLDADRIQRERERQRKEERSRIEHDRRERELELARLRRAELLQSLEVKKVDDRVDGAGTAPAPGLAAPGPAPAGSSRSSPAAGGGAARADRGSPGPRPEAPPGSGRASRAIGGRVRTPELQQFLAVDPLDRFDIQRLNTLPLPVLLGEIAADPELLDRVERRLGALMQRVKTEVDDPLSAGAFLREQVLLWFRTSPEDPEWAPRMTERWAGLLADSRVSGGKLHPWLNARLRAFHEEVVRVGRFGARVRHRLGRTRPAESAVARTPPQQIQAEAGQAILDDLAARPRVPEEPFPLVRLSELAVRRQVPTINEALSRLFSSPELGPFVVLHPNRYPDCDELQIRAPSPTASGAALAYALVGSRAARRGGTSPSASSRSRAPAEGAGAEGGEAEEVDATTIWESTSAASRAWPKLLEELRARKGRLDTPPKDHRDRAAYAALRDLLAERADVRAAFLAVRWRGRPSGLPLLVALLQKGTLAPEVVTDYEYLEAELGVWSADDPDWKPKDGRWSFRDWAVAREGTHREGFRYRAARAGAAPD